MTIRRRYVFYIEGYDPQGAAGYYRLFTRELRRFVESWHIQAKPGELVLDSDDIAHWDIETTTPNWQVSSRYEFLRLESIISSKMAQPLIAQLARAFVWMADDILSGTLFRVFGAAWRFGLNLLYPQVFILCWIAVSALAGYVVAALLHWFGLPPLVTTIAGAAVGIAVFFALRRFADSYLIIQVSSSWVFNRRYAQRRPNEFERPTELMAQRIVARCRAALDDEILVVGHSSGGGMAPIIFARALELDPDLGRHGPKVVLMTLGSLLPAYALHPRGQRMRDAIERLAIEPSIVWLDCQARRDVSNFWGYDPVDSIGHPLKSKRCNPLIWNVRFRDMLSDEVYARVSRSLFRMHFQFIMGGNRRASFDYFMLVCGPLPATDWQANGRALIEAFGPDGSYSS